MTFSAQIKINEAAYTLVQAKDGKRAYRRALRPAQTTDPGRLKEARWKLSGPIGASREGEDGFLGHDYSQGVETRFTDLLTSIARRTRIDLSGEDPIGGSISAALGSFILGATPLGGGTAATTPGDVQFIDIDRNYVFFHRGPFISQVDPTDAAWTFVQTVNLSAIVKGVEHWKGTGKIGFGSELPVHKRVTVTSSGSTYAPIPDVFASAMAVGNDRLWMVDQRGGQNNRASYTLDDMEAISNSFAIGDDAIESTGIGTLGPYTAMGQLNGAYSFTDAGKPVRLIDALRRHHSTNNAKVMTSLWGWLYIATDFGLYAWDGGDVVNPVGPEAIRDFEGPIGGPATAIMAWRDSLFCNYSFLQSATLKDNYILRGVFNPQTTPASGMPDWFVFNYGGTSAYTGTSFFASAGFEQINAIAAINANVSGETVPHLVWNEGDYAAWARMGRHGARDILDTTYVYDNANFPAYWYGTTMMRASGMLNSLRYARFTTEDCDLANYWAFEVSCDGESYIQVGPNTFNSGRQTLRPTSGLKPDDRLAFSTLKPRLVKTAASSTAPPQVRGYLDIVYDERPEQIEEVSVIVKVDAKQLADLEELAGPIGTPVEIGLPDTSDKRYGHVISVSAEDTDGSIVSATVTIHMWDVE